MTDKTMPALRFRGFYDAWEQRKLGNVVNVLDGDRGKNYPSRENFSNQGHTVFLSASNVTKNGFSFEVNQYISELKSNSMGNGKLIRNDIVLTSRGSLGHVAWYNDDLASTNPFVRINSGMLILRVLKDVDARYIVQYLKSPLGSKKIELISFGSAQPQLTKKDISNYGIELPSYEEQQKKGAFFKQLDNLITQNERKIDLLKQLKQAYLQKIFSQELRFTGFNDGWEERDLSAISDKVTEKNKENQFSETFTNSAEYGIIDQRDFFDKDISNEKNLNGYYIVHENDFVYNPRISNYAPVGPIKRNKLGRTGVMSPLYYVFRSRGVDKKYLEYYFDTTAWHIFLKMNGDSGARSDRFAIKDSVFNQMPIPYPTIGEQEQIGSFFEKLDKAIALHQQKLDLLKKQKQAYLQKLFI
ncbi:restriction endonuclease subunit S [Leuconostoc mesenteroides]|uniref:restriction endonuclease subunit S n=1 Tax=Leuconostoc mesenteroides TaxID=1245 RepID=UPI0032DEE196